MDKKLQEADSPTSVSELLLASMKSDLSEEENSPEAKEVSKSFARLTFEVKNEVEGYCDVTGISDQSFPDLTSPINSVTSSPGNNKVFSNPKEKVQVSILTTFYARLFCTKALCAAFL